jgi:ribosomal protein S18 acetylase RimI-like enzyme
MEPMESPGEISIRGFDPTDLSVLVDLVARTGAADWSPGQIRAAVEGPVCRVRLACSGPPGSGDRPVGFVLARRIVETLEIDLVGVAPLWRRKGVARLLLTHLLDAERSSGAAEARLELAAGNTGALGLYTGQGFVVVGRRARYYPDGDDALLLTARF